MNSLANENPQSWLSWFLRGLLIVIFLILLTKLFEIQIIKGSYYKSLAEENRIRHIPIPAPRGRILARGGEELVTNVEIKKRVKFTPGGAAEVTDDLTDALPDEIITDYKRLYPVGSQFAHASGYLAKVSEDEIGKINPDCPEKGPRLSGQLVGRTGLEEEYECLLLGTPGETLIEVNTVGEKTRTLGVRKPIPGNDLKTTINYGLQVETAAAMEDKKGAAIITDSEGQILAFYSNPSFDPNKIDPGLFQDPDLPFFNRVTAGTFHPGSVFKPVVSVAALEEEAIDRNYTFNDPGIITVNDFSYTNWFFTEYGRTEGVIGLTRALARSTDTFFYKIGELTGPENIAKWAIRFGLSDKTGIDIPGETKGLIPTPAWKKEVKKEGWFLGNTYHMAIGQGDVSTTPIEINTYISGIANGGRLCTPHFLLTDMAKCRDLGVKKENLALVREGMREVCAQGGTGYTFFDFADKHSGQMVGCKTGTAEVGTDGEPHAWFTLFAPIESPQVVATILVEKGGQGSQVSGPIARKIMDYYFQGSTTR